MEPYSRPILQVPSGILAPALRLYPSPASAFSRPRRESSASPPDTGMDLRVGRHHVSTTSREKSSHPPEAKSSSSGTSHHRRNSSSVKDKADSAKEPKDGGCVRKANSPGHRSPTKRVPSPHPEPRSRLSFSVDSLISKTSSPADTERGHQRCDRSSSPQSVHSESRVSEGGTPPPESYTHPDDSDSSRENSPNRPTSINEQDIRQFSPPVRPSALPSGLAGLPCNPFFGIGVSPWTGLSAPSCCPLLSRGPTPGTNVLPKLSQEGKCELSSVDLKKKTTTTTDMSVF